MNPTPETETATPTTDPETAGTAASGAEATAETKTGPKADLTKGSVAEHTVQDATPADALDGTGTDAHTGEDTDDTDDAEDLDDDELAAASRPSGLGSAAASIVAVCLGIVALTGTWTSRVLAERQGLVGQLKTGQSGTAEQQISAIYGDAWHVTAAINGAVALVALLIGVIVLTLPQRTGWVRPFALAGAVLGFLGLLVSLGMYFDLFAALPTATP
ncbi:hypothetical protein [Streptomyces scopuliridis]|uniref:Uncharacterized protein n=1 Tax=Streptomyces scopuliridis RB72 TaxID=1440053 RepID=A0A2T7T5J2_9ACTN|nr:hypothetical protein [Streptomyces scopuliridis]PVE10356.1 hypothetical protein Y717_33560 [Streptomyces scopuliridis RB72]